MGESATYSCSQYRLDGVQEFGTLIIVCIYMYLYYRDITTCTWCITPIGFNSVKVLE